MLSFGSLVEPGLLTGMSVGTSEAETGEFEAEGAADVCDKKTRIREKMSKNAMKIHFVTFTLITNTLTIILNLALEQFVDVIMTCCSVIITPVAGVLDCQSVVRAEGVEPSSLGWKPRVLPLYNARVSIILYLI